MKPFIIDFIRGPIDSILDSQTRTAAKDGGNALVTVADAQTRINRLALLCEAMWELLNEKLNVTDEELASKVHEVDMRDGKLDGKRRPELQKCDGCNRTIPTGRTTCVYCGAPLVATSFENI